MVGRAGLTDGRGVGRARGGAGAGPAESPPPAPCACSPSRTRRGRSPCAGRTARPRPRPAPASASAPAPGAVAPVSGECGPGSAGPCALPAPRRQPYARRGPGARGRRASAAAAAAVVRGWVGPGRAGPPGTGERASGAAAGGGGLRPLSPWGLRESGPRPWPRAGHGPHASVPGSLGPGALITRRVWAEAAAATARPGTPDSASQVADQAGGLSPRAFHLSRSPAPPLRPFLWLSPCFPGAPLSSPAFCG